MQYQPPNKNPHALINDKRYPLKKPIYPNFRVQKLLKLTNINSLKRPIVFINKFDYFLMQHQMVNLVRGNQ